MGVLFERSPSGRLVSTNLTLREIEEALAERDALRAVAARVPERIWRTAAELWRSGESARAKGTSGEVLARDRIEALHRIVLRAGPGAKR